MTRKDRSITEPLVVSAYFIQTWWTMTQPILQLSLVILRFSTNLLMNCRIRRKNSYLEKLIHSTLKTLLWLLLIIISGSNLPHFLMYILKRKNMLTNWRDLTKIGSTRMRHHEQHSTPTYLQVNIVFWSRHWMKVEWKMKIMKNSA